MTGYRLTLLVLLLGMWCGMVMAQNNTNSPYTRYGYGHLSDQGSSNSKAMGGVAYGLRDGSQVNFANPASYTAVDSLTFIFDGAVSLQNTNFSNGTLKQNAKNSSFDYITMQFRLAKWCGMSVGVFPFSNVGYSMGETREDAGNSVNSSTVTYSGEGGLHQAYVGLGFKIFKNFSVGANISYLWGDITRTSELKFPADATKFPFTRTLSTDIKDYKLDFGIQYTQQWGKKNALTLGAVFSPKRDLNNTTVIGEMVGNTTTGSTYSSRDSVATFGLPMTVGVGLAYVYDKRLTVGHDAAVGQGFLSERRQRLLLAHASRRGSGIHSQPVGTQLPEPHQVSGGSLLFLALLQDRRATDGQGVRGFGRFRSSYTAHRLILERHGPICKNQRLESDVCG